MINETNAQQGDQKKTSFGAHLKSVRETKGLGRKEVAFQLRLTEKKIAMMEQDRYPIDLPVTFIRGYLRAYAKLLQIPEREVKKAIEHIKPKQSIHQKMYRQTLDLSVNSNNYFIHFFTFVIIVSIVILVGMWWYTHYSINNPFIVENQTNMKTQTSQVPMAIS